MNEQAYVDAAKAFADTGKSAFPGHQGWEAFLFRDELHLYVKNPDLLLRTELQGIQVSQIRLFLHRRLDDTDPGLRRHLYLSLPGGLELFKVVTVCAIEVEIELENDSTVRTVELEGASEEPRSIISITNGDYAEANVSGVDCHLQGHHPSQLSIIALSNTRASFAVSTVAEVQVHDRVDANLNGVSITALKFAPASELKISNPPSNRSGKFSVQAVASTVVGDASQQEPVVLLGDAEIAVGTIEGLAIELRGNAILRTADRAANLRISGSGSLIVGREAENIEFEGSESDPPTNLALLSVANHGLVQNVAGSIRLGGCARAQINGSPIDGLSICELEEQSDANQTARGLVLRNFCAPVNLKGLQVLSTLSDNAAVAIPLITHRLPGRWNELRASKSFALKEHQRVLRADYAAALARVAESKGAPGSIRTRTAWLDYRMRQNTAEGLIERNVLRGYLLLGYGERVLAPVVAYIALALVFTGVVHWDDWSFSEEGWQQFGSTFRDWLLTPFHVLRLAEDKPDPLGASTWAFAGRVAIAVPFVISVLALRKYVKRDSSAN